MTERAVGHLDDAGQPCPHHTAPSLDRLLALAVLGSRHTGFNHDLASKLQGIMMSLDELAEAPQVRGDPELQRAAESALTAAQDLGTLLHSNRALGQVSIRTKAELRAVVAQAGERACVTLQGSIVDATVEAAIPSLVQALALVLDACAGPGRGRSLDVASSVSAGGIVLELTVVRPAPATQNELLALAVSVLRREGGDLHCRRSGDRMVIRLPAAEP